MAPHCSLLLLLSNIFISNILFSNIFLAVSGLEATECSSSQSCLPKEDCPAVAQLWDDFKEEKDRETKLSLLAEFKSKLCSLPPEPKYCCDLTEESETTTISPEEKIPSNGTFLPR